MAVKVVCDFCDKTLEVENGRYVFYTAKSPIIRKRYKYLCKSCADQLNDIFSECVSGESIKIGRKFAEINKARRERLGTKG